MAPVRQLINQTLHKLVRRVSHYVRSTFARFELPVLEQFLVFQLLQLVFKMQFDLLHQDFSHSKSVVGLAYSPAGKLLASAGLDSFASKRLRH
jgi:hypothetical protein